ncbi:MAG: septum formation initiator family protein [bacterium]|nr:septum formation initiator family protein [bacterium]
MIAKYRLKKNKIDSSRGRLVSVVFAVVLLLAGGLLFFSNWQMNQRRQQLASKVQDLGKEMALLENKNEELKSGLNSASQEGYLEKEAREKFQLKKPGEKVVTVLPPEETPEAKPVKPAKNFFEQILEKLMAGLAQW